MRAVFRVSWAAAGAVYRLLARWGPSNRLVAAVRTRRGLKWGLPAMGIGLLCFWAAASVTVLIRDGGPGWLNLVVVWVVWDAVKLTLAGPFSLVWRRRARRRERRAQRSAAVGA